MSCPTSIFYASSQSRRADNAAVEVKMRDSPNEDRLVASLLGPIGGIMIADYFVVRNQQLNVGALYDEEGEYRYTNGISIVAVVAFVLAVLPNLPGFLVTIKAIPATSVPGPLVDLYNYAWFVGFGLAFVIYLVLRRIAAKS